MSAFIQKDDSDKEIMFLFVKKKKAFSLSVNVPLADVLWDSRPLRLSTSRHFLPGIRGLVISLPITLARQRLTWPRRAFVHLG